MKKVSSQILDLIGIERERAKRSFQCFVEDAWHVLEPPSQPLIWNWSMGAMCEHLEAVHREEILSLLINIPPGLSKSVLVNVYFPAWEWTEKAHLKYMSFSYDQRLSLRDNRRCRDLIKSKWYRDRWGDTVILTKDQATKNNYVNTKGGWRLASTIGGDYGTGERANRLIIDDPHSVKTAMSPVKREEVLNFRRETLPSRKINMEFDSEICVMQRLHEQDYSGDALSKEHGDPDIVHLMLPMRFDPSRRCFTKIKPKKPIKITEEIRYEVEQRNQKEIEEYENLDEDEKDDLEPNLIDLDTMYCWDPRAYDGELLFSERFPENVVTKLEKKLGPYATAGQLDQSPRARTGNMFSRADVEIINVLPANMATIVRYWDLAGTQKTATNNPDATATVKMGFTTDGYVIIIHAQEFQEDASKVPSLIRNMSTQDDSKVIIGLPQDPGSAGKFQFKMLSKSLAGKRIRKVIESGDKETRAEPFADHWEVGNVKVLKGSWNNMYFDRMEMFPVGKKDITDASSGGYYILANPQSAGSVKSKGW